ncbi:MAG: hypothetical protein JNJ83_00470 [Verrucomicrobiaceae bacterium]|nr:hypothetical protein [Verrucomicrobiaceae bacterium]
MPSCPICGEEFGCPDNDNPGSMAQHRCAGPQAQQSLNDSPISNATGSEISDHWFLSTGTERFEQKVFAACWGATSLVFMPVAVYLLWMVVLWGVEPLRFFNQQVILDQKASLTALRRAESQPIWQATTIHHRWALAKWPSTGLIASVIATACLGAAIGIFVHARGWHRHRSASYFVVFMVMAVPAIIALRLGMAAVRWLVGAH